MTKNRNEQVCFKSCNLHLLFSLSHMPTRTHSPPPTPPPPHKLTQHSLIQSILCAYTPTCELTLEPDALNIHLMSNTHRTNPYNPPQPHHHKCNIIYIYRTHLQPPHPHPSPWHKSQLTGHQSESSVYLPLPAPPPMPKAWHKPDTYRRSHDTNRSWLTGTTGVTLQEKHRYFRAKNWVWERKKKLVCLVENLENQCLTQSPPPFSGRNLPAPGGAWLRYINTRRSKNCQHDTSLPFYRQEGWGGGGGACRGGGGGGWNIRFF